MGTQLATIEPIQLPDATRPAKMTLLPRWVAERLSILKKEEQPDSSGRFREVPILPQEMMLEQGQKQTLERHSAALDDMLQMTAEAGFAQKTLVAVSKMLKTLAGSADPLAAEAKGEAYSAALEDVAFWAVEEAIRRWYRGEYGATHDYRWPPDPATLRDLALLEQFRIKSVSRQCRDLIEARPPRFDEDHMAGMRKQLQAIGIATE